MNIKKLKYILNEKLGVPMDQWVVLKNVPVILSHHDASIYTDEKTRLYYFDTTNELIRVSYGDFSEFNENIYDPEAFVNHSIYDLGDIAGVSTTVTHGPQGTYYTKRF